MIDNTLLIIVVSLSLSLSLYIYIYIYININVWVVTRQNTSVELNVYSGRDVTTLLSKPEVPPPSHLGAGLADQSWGSRGIDQ